MKLRKFLVASLLVCSCLPLSAQQIKDKLITISFSNITLKEAMNRIEKSSGYTFFYDGNQVNTQQKVSLNVKEMPLDKAIEALFKKTGINYEVTSTQVALFAPNQSSSSTTRKQVKVSGMVTDATGMPVIGATILEKGTANGIITDIDGKFTISVSSNATLIASYVGYVPQQIKITNQSILDITLKEDSQALEEVVVVGFGSQKKANLTGAVATVKMDEVMGDRPLTSAADALQGAVPGLLVGSGGNSPGSSKSFQIRGAYSLGIQNSDGTYGATIAPLVLIDNVEGDIDMLNPDDIESITVMKDAASAAIYGARAAGGVILVTTKRPKGQTKFQLNYNNNFALANAINLPKQSSLTNTMQAYYDVEGDTHWVGNQSVTRWMELLNQYNNGSSLTTAGDGIYKDSDGTLYFLNEKDLVKNMLESSFQQTHNMSVSGGTDKLRYRLSAGYVDSDGVLITDKDAYRRLNVSSFVSADITKWFTQEATLSYAHSKKTTPNSPTGGIYSLRLASYYPEGNMPEGYGNGTDDNLPFFTPKNQVLDAQKSNTINDNPRIFLKSILKPIKNLEVAFEYTYDKNIYDYSYYAAKWQYTTVQLGLNEAPSNDYLNKVKRSTDYNAFNLYATYGFDLAEDHNFKVMAGFNQESSYRETVSVYSYDQAVAGVPSLGGGTGTLKATDTYNEYAVRGGFFRVNYNYKDKYLLEINGRYDGSSKFPKDSRFGFFPSVSAGWNITQEKFMENTQDWLSMLKLRASYGVIGNQNIAKYAFIPSMSLNNKYSGWLKDGNLVTAVTTLPALVSTDFTWEKVSTLNIGLDFSFFNNRLSGLFEWYQKDTKGMLAPGMQLPEVVGAAAPYQNTADMRTKGWEVNLNWRDQIGKVNYRVGFNLSDSKSEIVKYDSNESKLLSNYYEGQVLGEIWGYVFDGFYSVNDFVDTQTWKLKDGVVAINGYNPRPGDVKFKNLLDDQQGDNLIYSGDGTVENPGDRKIIGNYMPRYLYGINLGASYAGFDLSIFLQGTGKRDYWIENALTVPMGNDRFLPLYEGLENYWRPMDAANGNYECANPDAEYPRIYSSYGNAGSNWRNSDKYLSDASYLRIKNVSLSYTFPKAWVNKLSLSNLKAFVNVENLATFTSLPKGIDPETLSWSYPAFRTVSFGLNLSL